LYIPKQSTKACQGQTLQLICPSSKEKREAIDLRKKLIVFQTFSHIKLFLNILSYLKISLQFENFAAAALIRMPSWAETKVGKIGFLLLKKGPKLWAKLSQNI
jgi:hypothetical protein